MHIALTEKFVFSIFSWKLFLKEILLSIPLSMIIA